MPQKKSSDTALNTLNCVSCTRKFVSLTALADHHRSKHAVFSTPSAAATNGSNIGPRGFVSCTVVGCARTFASQQALEQHLDSSIHADKKDSLVQKPRKVSNKPSLFQGGSSETHRNMSSVPGTIPTENIHFAAPTVMEKATTTLNSLTSHFGSSLHISTPPHSPTMDSPHAPQTSKEVLSVRERAVAKNPPKKRRPTKRKAQAPKAQTVEKWTVIPQHQQLAALTSLTLRCHTRDILAANKYPSDTNNTSFVENREKEEEEEEEWGGEATPTPLKTPTHHDQSPKRRAIALDCEMVRVSPNNVSELARISAIDYLTNEILIDTLVQPTQPVADWRTKYSGITRDAMEIAISQGQTLRGWPEARALLFAHVDAETVLVGHALHNDLIALGIQHRRVVDSAILTSEAVGRAVKRRWGLKDLCNQLVNIKIQGDEKLGHNSVEDAFAAREVVLWCVEHPGALKRWGKKQRREYYGREKQKAKAKAMTASRRVHPSYIGVELYAHDEDDEMVTWSDIAEACGWPHPDTGYDPWSD